jgi:formylglycine-generating enzyme required for sulfatase activity
VKTDTTLQTLVNFVSSQLVNLTSTLINRLTALKSLLDLGDVELVSVAASRLVEHQYEPAIQEIQAALADHRYAEAVRMIEKLLSDCSPQFIGLRAGEEKDLVIAAGVKMTFCWCPPGEFLMGSHKNEKGRYINEDQVHVILSQGFWMAKTQVTQKQWVAIMNNNPSEYKGDNLPVEMVSWGDAKKFLKKLNAKIGNIAGKKMILPTEAQWEYACRAGELGPYSGGTVDEVAWYEDYTGDKTHPVGMKKPNAWGLHDMHGNVWEWCSDRYAVELLGGIDPSGPASGVNRVIRGASWGNPPVQCRSACRWSEYQSFSNFYLGFRPAMVPKWSLWRSPVWAKIKQGLRRTA